MCSDQATPIRRPLTPRSQVVHVVLLRSVADDLDLVQEVQRKIFERLGHAMSVSGIDVRWDHEQQLLVDDDLAVRPR